MTLRRIAAFLLDWLIIIGYAAVLVPFGVALGDRLAGLPVAVLNAGAFVVLILPATVWLAAWERGGVAATPGKRVLGLRVAGSLGWRRSLVRSFLKLALPWELGHTAVYALSTGTTPVLGTACLVLAYGLLFVCLGYAVFTGRTPYDRIVGSQVVRVVDGRTAG